MIVVVAAIKVLPGRKDEFIDIFKANLPAVHAEAGCIEYFPTTDTDSGVPVQVLDDNLVTIIEKWESMDHLKAHMTAPHMLAYREKVKDIVEGTELRVLKPV
ncbi:MAG: antibiotic biosynthesis monooxygenase [Granulosicoccus sp.]|nr:antibiotic biosynthesis monooxygenase [Granulosicoccus sp.]